METTGVRGLESLGLEDRPAPRAQVLDQHFAHRRRHLLDLGHQGFERLDQAATTAFSCAFLRSLSA